MTTKRLIVAITGASGAIYGIRLLQVLRTLPGWETHLVMSASGALTASQEVDLKRSEIEAHVAAPQLVARQGCGKDRP